MDTAFHKIDLETWERREEYEYFSRGGCGFTVTAELDITHLRRYAKAHGAKPVSYTHLDVYKRQFHGNPDRFKAGEHRSSVAR